MVTSYLDKQMMSSELVITTLRSAARRSSLCIVIALAP